MHWQDNWRYSYLSLRRYPLRTALLIFAVAIGVASVLLLTSIGEGAKRFVEKEFSALGTDILIILPGKKETTGSAPPVYGTSPRDLTIEDALALKRIANVDSVAPVIAGTVLISSGRLAREVITLGTNAEFFTIRELTLAQGQSLPLNSTARSSQVCILGSRLKQELFGNTNPLGQWLRFGDRRFRVIGVLAQRGESLGLDMRDMALIPIRSAETLFNSPAVFRILLRLKHNQAIKQSQQAIVKLIKNRHDGDDDITFISQNSVMSAFNNIIHSLTLAIFTIASISLLVAGFLIMNVSYISVRRRRTEIGLLKAIGASAFDVHKLFLTESLLLVGAGITAGALLGSACTWFAFYLFPDFQLVIPLWAFCTTTLLTLTIGLLCSWLPAAEAARQDPVEALAGA
jgi:putative ABC transport system permease protein